jgi:hypothetical protein
MEVDTEMPHDGVVAKKAGRQGRPGRTGVFVPSRPSWVTIESVTKDQGKGEEPFHGNQDAGIFYNVGAIM